MLRRGSVLLAFLVGLAIAFLFNAFALRFQPDYSGQISSLTSERDEAGETNGKLKNQIEKLKGRLGSGRALRAKHIDLTQKHKQLGERLTRIRAARDDLTARSEKLTLRVANLEQALEAKGQNSANAGKLNAEISRLKGLVDESQAKRREMRDRLVKIRQSRDTQAKRVTELEAALSSRNTGTTNGANAEISRLTGLLGSARDERSSLQSLSDGLTGRLKKIGGKLALVTSARQEFKTMLKERGQENNALIERGERSRAQIRRLRGYLSRSDDEATRLAAALKAERGKAKKLAGKVGLLTSARQEFKTMLKERTQKSTSLSERAQRARVRVGRLETRLDRSEAEVARLQNLLKSEQVGRASAVSQHDGLAGKIKKLAGKLALVTSARQEFKLMLKERGQANASLSRQNESATDRIQRLSAANEQLRSARDAVWERVQKQNQAGKAKLAAANKRHNELRATLQKVRAARQKGLAAAQQCRAGADQCRARLASLRDGLSKQRQARANACQLELQRIAKAGRILFASGSAVLTRSSFQTVNRLATQMQKCSGLSIAVEGHTDSSGRVDANKALSEQRAASVKTYLVRKGVAPARLKAIGYGSAKPVATNVTPEGRRANRRIQFSVGN